MVFGLIDFDLQFRYHQIMDEELKKMTAKVEYMLLKRIVTGLKDKSITAQEAKEYAQTFLAIEPFQSFEDAKAKVDQFASLFPALEELRAYIDAYHHEQKVDAVIQKMQTYIGENKLDEALQVAQA